MVITKITLVMVITVRAWGQKGNVWRLNNIKHCLVTKHVDVEVSGQTVETYLI